MPRPSKLTEAHRDAVASGRETVASVADILNIGRATAWRQFRLRNWPTRPVLKERVGEGPDRDADVAQDAREAVGAVKDHPEPESRPKRLPGGPAPHLAQDLPLAAYAGPDDLLDAVREVAANNALLALARVAELLTDKPGASAVRLALQAQGFALDQLRSNLGVDLDATADAGPPQMLFLEMTAEEIEEAQRQAEAAHQGLDLDDDQDAEAAA